MKQFKYIIFLALIPFLLYACAQIGTLGGGEKDEEPPVFLRAVPPEKSLNFNEDKIILYFDEFFVLNNLNSVFISSPFMAEAPDFEINRKKLLVKLKEGLLDSTTYHFWFGDAIEDYHENNPLKNFKFVFSTGPVLDTMEVGGKVFNAKNLRPLPDMHVILYKEYRDSTPIIEKPYYITKSDTAGKFKIDYIKPGKYRIFALNDQDGNYQFNLPNERIAYIDSLIIPDVETQTRIDSLKAGTVLHRGEDDETGDTLTTDTVLFVTEHIYSPLNLKLFAFVEDKEKQYIFNLTRERKGKFSFEFNKPVSDDIEIFGLDFYLDFDTVFIEKADSFKTLHYWIKDPSIYKEDSLEFTLAYFNKDSAGNPFKEEDTVLFIFDIAGDTLENPFDFIEPKTEQDSFSRYLLETETPVQSYDTTRIQLFELYDTLVADKRDQQLLRSIRPAPDKLVFSLKRPYVNIFDIRFLHTDTVVPIEKNYSESDTLLECLISDNQVSMKDTLTVLLSYDNDYFLGQTQTFFDTLVMPLYKQGLERIERPAPDTIILSFKKEVSEETKISVSDQEIENWYDIIAQNNKEKLFLKVINNDLKAEDTLILTVRTNDFDNTSGEKIDYEYSKTAVFKRKVQKIIKHSRPEKDMIFFVLNVPPDDEFKISLKKEAEKRNWYEKTISEREDTVFFKITDPSISEQDTLHILADYYPKLSGNLRLEKTDTFALIYRKYKRRRRRDKSEEKEENYVSDSGEKLFKVSIELPVNYRFFKDSVSERKMYLDYPWKPGNDYIVKIDSGAMIDFWQNKCVKKESKFTVRTKDYYGAVHVNLTNIKRISDTDFYQKQDTILLDSVEYSVLSEGQLLLSLTDAENKLIEMKAVTKDDTLIFNNLDPGNYRLKAVYDRNLNKKWDTGEFLKHIQPERVLLYPSEITIQSNWINVADWKIAPPEN